MASLKPQQKVILATVFGVLFILALIALRPGAPVAPDAVTPETTAQETPVTEADIPETTVSPETPEFAPAETEIAGTPAPEGTIIPVRKPVVNTDGTITDAPVPAAPAPEAIPAAAPEIPATPVTPDVTEAPAIPEATPEPEPAPIPAPEAPAPAETVTPAAPGLPLSEDGLYGVECVVPAIGTVLGQVEADDEDTHPGQQKAIGIKNRNTGKVTTVPMDGANCLFTPISQ